MNQVILTVFAKLPAQSAWVGCAIYFGALPVGATPAAARIQATQCGQLQVATLHKPHPLGFNEFGASVAVSGGTLAVGDPADSTRGPDAGAVFVFQSSDPRLSTWNRTAILTPTDGGPGQLFGRVVVLDETTLVVGQPLDGDKGYSAGAVYVFERDPGAADKWRQSAKLTATDGGREALFGFSLAICGNAIAVGANFAENAGVSMGAVYLFERTDDPLAPWVEVQKVFPPEGHVDDRFGNSVALSADYLAVGAFGDDSAAGNAGAAFVYERAGRYWKLAQKLTAPDASVGDGLFSIALTGNQLIAGASGDDDLGPSSGSAYVFERLSSGWVFKQKLHALGGSTGDEFGLSLVAEGGRLIFVSPFVDSSGRDSGAAYEFRREVPSGPWLQAAALTPIEVGPGTKLGAVSISDSVVVLGAKQSLGPGAAYVFQTRHGTTTTTFCEPSPPQMANCVPAISAQGSPTASGTGDFLITSGRVPGAHVGLFIYTHGQDRLPINRIPGMCFPRLGSWSSQLLFSNGNFGQCDGSLVLVWNELLAYQAGVDPQLSVPGTQIQGQFVYFGFPSAGRLGFTDAVEFVTCP